MRKKVLAILGTSVVMIFIIGYGLSFLLANTTPSEEEIDIAQTEIDEFFYEEGKDFDDSQLIEVSFVGKDKYMTELTVQDLIHSMSHQKVKAKQKWGRVILITQEKVATLIKIVETNYNKYEHSDIYLDILNRWYANDFSKADKDHNAIWKLQNGNIGDATGLLNAVEELEYIEQNGVR